MPNEIQPQDIFFALDIGTRSVIGIIGIIENDDYVRILDIESIEHPKRAMIDGQIEDIAQVSRIAGLVKSRLEERSGYTLTRVNVAAAGRALKTHKCIGELELSRDSVIDASIVRNLETTAITKANEEVVKNQQNSNQTQFFCVGYSVMRYMLDDYPISTLIGHKGSTCTVEMIVTFLPNEVVESLYSAMNGIELQVESLTLEPIAAMNAVIPQELRTLNLALVDIGAGTSDIAISNHGSVVAYAMATVAGDEVTEMLTKKYIVDFETAEKMKQDLSLNTADVSFSDILGNDYTVPASEVFETIKPALEHLCNVICEKILEVNEVAPSAVFLVGGASKIPYLCGLVADKLEIDPKKVGVGGSKPLKKTVVSECDIFSPEFVTPIGIIITAAKQVALDDLVVTVNNERVTLFRRAGVTVMDLLLSSGYRYSQMLGTSGKSLIYTLNGEKKIVRGGYPTPATISVNGKATSLFMPVNGGDIVEISPAVVGTDAEVFVRDIASGSFDINITLNDKAFAVGTRIMRGEIPLNQGDVIYQNDIIYTIELRNIFDLADYLNLNIDDYIFTSNGSEVNGGYTFKSDDVIRYASKDMAEKLTQDESTTPIAVSEVNVIAEPEITDNVDYSAFKLDDAPVSPTAFNQIPQQIIESAPVPATAPTRSLDEINDLLMNQRVSSSTDIEKKGDTAIRITLNGRAVELEPKVDRTPYLFFDMLNLVNIDPSKPQGNIILKHNNEEASFMTPVQNGDIIDIHWEQTR